MQRKKIVIIDYELSNLFSVKHACEYFGYNAEIISNPSDLLKADAAILPGVGAFGDAMGNLHKHKLAPAIKKFVDSGRPFMGICLGMQLIFEESEEFGIHKGLGLLKGKVKKFPSMVGKNIIHVPQIGWNRIYSTGCQKDKWNVSCLKNIENGQFMYFVHSYYVVPETEEDILAKTNYENFEYTSAILRNNIFAVQFHPEKSARKGLSIYKNFFDSIK